MATLARLLDPFLKGQARQRIFLLRENVLNFAEIIGPARLAFGTFTPKVKIYDPRAFGEWFKVLVNSDTFKAHFARWCRVFEEHEDGSWHVHMLLEVIGHGDLREGFDFDHWQAFKDHFSGRNGKPKNRGIANRELRDCCDASHPIRAVWSAMAARKERAANQGLSMIEPIYTTAEAVGKYLSKYLSKDLGRMAAGRPVAKGVRRYGFGGKAPRKIWSGFAWNSPGRRERSRKIGEFAKAAGLTNYEDLRRCLGPRWSWHCRDIIRNWKGTDEDIAAARKARSDAGFATITSGISPDTSRKSLPRKASFKVDWDHWEEHFDKLAELVPGLYDPNWDIEGYSQENDSIPDEAF